MGPLIAILIGIFLEHIIFKAVFPKQKSLIELLTSKGE